MSAAIDSQFEFMQLRCQMSSHAVGRIYLKLISFIEVILLKRSEAASFWPAVPILLAVAVVAEQTLAEDSPGRKLTNEADSSGA